MNKRSAAGKVQGTWNESSRNKRSRERMVRGGRSAGFIRFSGTNGPGNESSRERTVQGTNVPRNEWSWERKFHHGNECSRERIVLGTNIPDTGFSRDGGHSCRTTPPVVYGTSRGPDNVMKELAE